MNKQIPKPNRCKECGKILREENKSGLCSYHYKIIRKRKKL